MRICRERERKRDKETERATSETKRERQTQNYRKTSPTKVDQYASAEVSFSDIMGILDPKIYSMGCFLWGRGQKVFIIVF